MAMGHDVLIACQPESGILREARKRGIATVETSIRGSWDIRAMVTIGRIIRKHGISVVNTHSGKDTWVGGFAARLAGSPLFVRTRHLAIPISNSPLNFIHKLADGIITTGESVREALISHNRVSPHRIVSIPTGVPLEKFSPELDGAAIRRELGIAPGRRVVTIVAILRKIKRHDLFLEMARQLLQRYPDLVFLIVGDGPMRDEIIAQRKVSGLEQDVIMTGHREDIPDIIAASDIVVLTSDKEGVPQSLSQAMAMAKPVVAAPVGGIPDLVLDYETGLFADAGSGASFTAKVSELLDNESLRTSLGKSAREHVLNQFTAEIMAERTIEFYDKLSVLRSQQLQ